VKGGEKLHKKAREEKKEKITKSRREGADTHIKGNSGEHGTTRGGNPPEGTTESSRNARKKGKGREETGFSRMGNSRLHSQKR